jgi:hypothetical protein
MVEELQVENALARQRRVPAYLRLHAITFWSQISYQLCSDKAKAKGSELSG